ncbi:MAG: hypothetical protein ACRED8_09420 [Caulobacteraceae bacterium]
MSANPDLYFAGRRSGLNPAGMEQALCNAIAAQERAERYKQFLACEKHLAAVLKAAPLGFLHLRLGR